MMKVYFADSQEIWIIIPAVPWPGYMILDKLLILHWPHLMHELGVKRM